MLEGRRAGGRWAEGRICQQKEVKCVFVLLTLTPLPLHLSGGPSSSAFPGLFLPQVLDELEEMQAEADKKIQAQLEAKAAQTAALKAKAALKKT